MSNKLRITLLLIEILGLLAVLFLLPAIVYQFKIKGLGPYIFGFGICLVLYFLIKESSVIRVKVNGEILFEKHQMQVRTLPNTQSEITPYSQLKAIHFQRKLKRKVKGEKSQNPSALVQFTLTNGTPLVLEIERNLISVNLPDIYIEDILMHIPSELGTEAVRKITD